MKKMEQVVIVKIDAGDAQALFDAAMRRFRDAAACGPYPLWTGFDFADHAEQQMRARNLTTLAPLPCERY